MSNIKYHFNQFLSQKHSVIPDKTLCAHELAQEDLANILSRTNESDPIFNPLDYTFKQSFHNFKDQSMFHTLENGWTITAQNPFYLQSDKEYLFIPTALSTNRITELIKQDKNNPLAIELAVQRFMFNQEEENYKSPTLLVLACNKIYTHYRAMSTEQLEVIELTNTYTDREIHQMLLDKTNALQEHLDNNTTPDKCTELRWHKQKGKNRPMQCMYYCPVSKVCPHYSSRTRTKNAINNLLF